MVTELIRYPVVEPWDGPVGVAAVASALPLAVIFGKQLRFFCFLFLFALLVFTGKKYVEKLRIRLLVNQ